MAGNRAIATGTRLNGERVEIKTPSGRMGLDRYCSGMALHAEMRAMDIQLGELIPFDQFDIDSETGRMSRKQASALENGLGQAALDGLDILKER